MSHSEPRPAPASPDAASAVLGRLSAVDAAIRGGEHLVAHCRSRLTTSTGGALPPAEREALEGDLLAAMARNAERQAQRHALVAELEPTLRRVYDEIHRRGLHPAVVLFDGNGACPGCHLRVPPQRQVELRARGALTCPHCGRLLYVTVGARPGAYGTSRDVRSAVHQA